MTAYLQPDHDITNCIYLEYRDWVPLDQRTPQELKLHNEHLIERWNLALRNNLCSWCAKLDLQSLRYGVKELNWERFQLISDALTTDAGIYLGCNRPRKFRVWQHHNGADEGTSPQDGPPSQEQTESEERTSVDVSIEPMRLTCPFCKVLRDFCRENMRHKGWRHARLVMDQPIAICGHDCDQSEPRTALDMKVCIGNICRTVTVIPLLESPTPKRPVKHNCMTKHDLPPVADFKQLAGWIHTCDKEHGHLKGDPVSSVTSVLFIDVNHKCIVQGSFQSRYAALSYTWGSRQQFQLNKKWLVELKEQDSLVKVFHRLPKTVTDAIMTCERLNIPFLWIDALCIVDDDPEAKHAQIANMDLIYSQAYITLIGAAGDDAYAGLARVTTDKAPKTWAVRIDNLVYGLGFTWHQTTDDIDYSRWRTRGWTFQEVVLSKRVMAFSSTEALFYCDQGFKAESVQRREGMSYSSGFGAAFHLHSNVLTICNSVRPPLENTSIDWTIDSVRRAYEEVHWPLLNDYLNRQLSYDTDILAAFSGVLNAERATIGPTHWGLPCKILTWALFWDLNNKSLWRSNGRGQNISGLKSSEFSMIRRQGFPSWSWTGWKISINPLFSWRKEGRKLRCLINYKKFEPFVHIHGVQLGKPVSISGTRSENEGVEGFDPVRIRRLNRQLGGRWKSKHKLDPELIPPADFHQRVPQYCLLFIASFSTLQVSTMPRDKCSNGDRTYGLYTILTGDKNSHDCPGVWLDTEWREKQGLWPLEFILLAIDVEKERLDKKVYFTMLIEYKELTAKHVAIAERVAIPEPFTLDQWRYARPEPRWIALG